MHWTAEMDALLIANRPTKSSAAIAKLLGNGVTRKAVIGRAWRLKLPLLRQKKGPDVKQKMQAKQDGPRSRGTRIEPKVHLPPPEPVPSLNLSIFDLEPNSCRFPTGGEGIETMFCGQPVAGKTYCAGHQAIAYTRPGSERPQFTVLRRKNIAKSIVFASLDAA